MALVHCCHCASDAGRKWGKTGRGRGTRHGQEPRRVAAQEGEATVLLGGRQWADGASSVVFVIEGGLVAAAHALEERGAGLGMGSRDVVLARGKPTDEAWQWGGTAKMERGRCAWLTSVDPTWGAKESGCLRPG